MRLRRWTRRGLSSTRSRHLWTLITIGRWCLNIMVRTEFVQCDYSSECFIEAIHTIDFTLELRDRCRLVSSDRNARVYYYLISVAGGTMDWNGITTTSVTTSIT